MNSSFNVELPLIQMESPNAYCKVTYWPYGYSCATVNPCKIGDVFLAPFFPYRPFPASYAGWAAFSI